eukprot:519309-Ditylum_brightwellii.AAC.1
MASWRSGKEGVKSGEFLRRVESLLQMWCWKEVFTSESRSLERSMGARVDGASGAGNIMGSKRTHHSRWITTAIIFGL